MDVSESPQHNTRADQYGHATINDTTAMSRDEGATVSVGSQRAERVPLCTRMATTVNTTSHPMTNTSNHMIQPDHHARNVPAATSNNDVRSCSMVWQTQRPDFSVRVLDPHNKQQKACYKDRPTQYAQRLGKFRKGMPFQSSQCQYARNGRRLSSCAWPDSRR
jgi:hypothetical protein